MRQFVKDLSESAIARMEALLIKGHPLCVSVSWGKDSNVCLVLMLEAVKRVKAAGHVLPQCYVINSNTTLENPALEEYFQGMEAELDVFINRNNLPVEYVQVEPPLTANFFYVTVGRGKLPRYPWMSRDCSVDWKINPIIRGKKSLPNAELPKISVVGTRLSESVDRKKRMEERGDSADAVQVNTEGDHYITPIADWEVEDVWGLLAYCDQSNNPMFSTFVKNFDETIELYKDANGGECVAALGDRHLNSAACGARFGCWACVATGENDKSIQAMISTNPEKYGYLAPIAKLRDWIYSLGRDLNRRTWLGRSVDKVTNHVVLHPDYLDFNTRRDLLRYILTIQAEENEWAEREGEGFVRFNLYKFSHIVAIDFMWAMYRDAPHGFSVLHEYYQIHHCGRRYPLPEAIHMPAAQPVPKKRWFKLPDHGISPLNGIGGLHDPIEIAVGKELRECEPVTLKDRVTGEHKEVVPFDVVPRMEVDPLGAWSVISHYCNTPMCIETTKNTPEEAAYYYLNMGIVKLGKSQAAGLDEMMQKASLWRNMQMKLNIADIEGYALENSLSDKEHKELKLSLMAKGEVIPSSQTHTAA